VVWPAPFGPEKNNQLTWTNHETEIPSLTASRSCFVRSDGTDPLPPRKAGRSGFLSSAQSRSRKMADLNLGGHGRTRCLVKPKSQHSLRGTSLITPKGDERRPIQLLFQIDLRTLDAPVASNCCDLYKSACMENGSVVAAQRPPAKGSARKSRYLA